MEKIVSDKNLNKLLNKRFDLEEAIVNNQEEAEFFKNFEVAPVYNHANCLSGIPTLILTPYAMAMSALSTNKERLSRVGDKIDKRMVKLEFVENPEKK